VLRARRNDLPGRQRMFHGLEKKCRMVPLHEPVKQANQVSSEWVEKKLGHAHAIVVRATHETRAPVSCQIAPGGVMPRPGAAHRVRVLRMGNSGSGPAHTIKLSAKD